MDDAIEKTEYSEKQVRTVFGVVLETVADEFGLFLTDESKNHSVDYYLRESDGRLVASVSYATKHWSNKRKHIYYNIYINHCTYLYNVDRLSDFGFSFISAMRRYVSGSRDSILIRKITFKDVSDKPIVYTDPNDAKDDDVITPVWLL